MTHANGHGLGRRKSRHRRNLTVDEMRQLMTLSAKGADRPSALAIEPSASNVTPQMPPVSPGPSGPTIGETMDEQRARNLVQPATPSEPRPVARAQTSPPLPGDDDYVEEDEPTRVVDVIEMPPPPQVRKPTPTLREVAERQERLSVVEQEIEFWESQLAMLADPDNHSNATLYRTKIADLKRQRDLASVTITRS
jgi:hypothetical protein